MLVVLIGLQAYASFGIAVDYTEISGM